MTEVEDYIDEPHEGHRFKNCLDVDKDYLQNEDPPQVIPEDPEDE